MSTPSTEQASTASTANTNTASQDISVEIGGKKYNLSLSARNMLEWKKVGYTPKEYAEDQIGASLALIVIVTRNQRVGSPVGPDEIFLDSIRDNELGLIRDAIMDLLSRAFITARSETE